MKFPRGVSTLPYYKDGANDGRINVELHPEDYEDVEAGTKTVAQRADDLVREMRRDLKDTATWESATEDAEGDAAVRDALVEAYVGGFRLGVIENLKDGLAKRAERRKDGFDY